MRAFLTRAAIVTGCILITSFCISCSESPDSKTHQTLEVSEKEPDPFEGKKVVYVNSYHRGLPWSDGIERRVRGVLTDAGVDFKVHHMDTKRNQSKKFALKAALAAKNLIEAYKPDVLIVSDDNAFRYLVKDHYRDAALPVVFCGVNWNVDKYEGPYTNTAGMVEVVLFDQSIKTVLPYANGARIGFLAEDTFSEHTNAENLVDFVGLNLVGTAFVKDFDQWKEQYIELQKNVDILLVGVMGSFIDWRDTGQKNAVVDFTMAHTRIPTVTDHVWMVEFTLLAYGKLAEEQGEWAASSALELLKGKAVTEIGVVRNQSGELAINFRLAEKLGIVFAPGIIKNAKIFE